MVAGLEYAGDLPAIGATGVVFGDATAAVLRKYLQTIGEKSETLFQRHGTGMLSVGYRKSAAACARQDAGAVFENMMVMEVIKHRFNQGKEDGVFFYRDSNQNEVDILLKQEGEITAIEVKSSMTYHPSFEKTLRHQPEWIRTPVTCRAVVYAGDFENVVGDVKLVNFNNLSNIL